MERIQDDALLARLQQNRDACKTVIRQQYQYDDEYMKAIKVDKNYHKKIVVEITIDVNKSV